MSIKELKERFERRLLDEKEIEFLFSKVEEMQKTLEWYADEAIWVTAETDGVYGIEPIEYIGDGPWIKARQALKGVETK